MSANAPKTTASPSEFCGASVILDLPYVTEKYRLDIRGVIHVGAHYGEEIDTYVALGIPRIVCFEPLAENFAVLQARHGSEATLFNYALGAEATVVEMFLSSNEKQSSSVLKPADHLRDHPGVTFSGTERVRMRTLDSFKDELAGCNLLSIDVQGYEFEVLVGGSAVLSQIDYLYLEVNRGETYEGNRLVSDLDDLLSDYRRIETAWAARTWGDALYVRTPLLDPRVLGREVDPVETEPSRTRALRARLARSLEPIFKRR
jgi:FkbM family methyltransferase